MELSFSGESRIWSRTSQAPTGKQTEWPLIKQLSYQGSSEKMNPMVRTCDVQAFEPFGATAGIGS